MKESCSVSKPVSYESSYCPPAYSENEELANALTHGISAIFAIGALIYMLALMPSNHSALQKTSIIVYGVSLILMFSMSTLYHAVVRPGAKQIFKKLYHCAIYLLIAGTYTPIMTIAVQTPLSDFILLTVWVLALAGIIFKIFFTGRFQIFSVVSYLAMSWLGLVMVYQLYQALEASSFTLLLLGGGAYTLGVIFYMNKKIPFNHAIWHGFVTLGALSHCGLIAFYVVPVVS